MKTISTKTGDSGWTGLRGGQRVPKDDLRIETNGEIDRLNACLGLVRALMPEDHPWKRILPDIQWELMRLMSHIATPQGESNPKPLQAAALTAEMEAMMTAVGAPAGFVVPGRGNLSAHIHLARAQARTAERRLWTLHRQYPLPAASLAMMNRLSDFLFVLALLAEKEESESNTVRQ